MHGGRGEGHEWLYKPVFCPGDLGDHGGEPAQGQGIRAQGSHGEDPLLPSLRLLQVTYEGLRQGGDIFNEL